MLPLSAAELLEAWELGTGLDPIDRARVLLTAAVPERSESELAAFTIGRRDAALLSMHEAMFGRSAGAIASCPGCGEQVEFSFSIEEIYRRSSVDGIEGVDPASISAKADGFTIEFRLPTLADLEAIRGAEGVDQVRNLLLHRCVIDIRRRKRVVPIDQLSEEGFVAIEELMARHDPTADVTFALSCEMCGARWSAPLDVPAFLWSQVDAWARRLLIEVDALAYAYGWSEDAIISLSPVRRRAYIELALTGGVGS